MNPKLPDKPEQRVKLLHEELTARVLKAFYKTYSVLGYGFLESVYKNALAIELRSMGFQIELETPKTVFYFEHPVGLYKIDHLVEDKVALELKATDVLNPNDKRQLINFLRASTVDVGLLLHYGPEAKFYRYLNPRLL